MFYLENLSIVAFILLHLYLLQFFHGRILEMQYKTPSTIQICIGLEDAVLRPKYLSIDYS